MDGQRKQDGDAVPDSKIAAFYEAMKGVLEENGAPEEIIREVIYICKRNGLADRSPEQRCESIRTILFHLDPIDDRGWPTRDATLTVAYQGVLEWLEDQC